MRPRFDVCAEHAGPGFDTSAVRALDDRSCLAPGGALLARTATGSAMIREVMETGMATDPAFDAKLLEVERGPWFRTIAVGFRALV